MGDFRWQAKRTAAGTAESRIAILERQAAPARALGPPTPVVGGAVRNYGIRPASPSTGTRLSRAAWRRLAAWHLWDVKGVAMSDRASDGVGPVMSGGRTALAAPPSLAIQSPPSTEAILVAAYGPLLSGASLAKALGYPSTEAFRQAASRGRLPVPVFALPHRRGRFARAADIARWLSGLVAGNAAEQPAFPTPARKEDLATDSTRT